MSGNHNMYCSANELADADDVIHKLQSLSEAYPTDIFPEIIEQDIEYINAVNQNLSARFFAHVGRHFIKKGFEPAITMLRQQQAKLDKYEQVLQSIANEHIELSHDKIKWQCESHVRWAKEALK